MRLCWKRRAGLARDDPHFREPVSMWRDIALTNKDNLSAALLKLEQRLAHIRENLDSKELAMEFDRAHQLRKELPVRKVPIPRARGKAH